MKRWGRPCLRPGPDRRAFGILIGLAFALAAAQPLQTWVARYGSAQSDDDPASVAVDRQGNVIVTGSSFGSGPDFLTVKYGPDRAELWTAHYGNRLTDRPAALAVDDSGNVYVAGTTGIDAADCDYLTIKYSSDGTECWVRQYDGAGHGLDSAQSIAVDRQGNAYVTGASASARSGHDFDCVTIKYSSDGDVVWADTFNRRDSADDFGRGIALDAAGNVYVAGTCAGQVALIHYRPNGDTAWARYHAGGTGSAAVALALDRFARVFVTGTQSSGATGDFLALRYDSLGGRGWAATWDGPGHDDDAPVAIGLDYSGNVFIAGSCHLTATNIAYALVKFSSAGSLWWDVTHDGIDTLGADYASGLTVDRSGNAIVTGRSWSSVAGHDYDYLTVKYNGSGQQLWEDWFDGPGEAQDEARGIASDSSGNAYVTGASLNTQNDLDFVTLKYTAGGTRTLFATYAGAGGEGTGDDCARFVARDAASNVYVAGRSAGAITTVKYDPDGAQLWRRSPGAALSGDDAVGLCAVPHGGAYVLGRHAEAGLPDIFTYLLLRYDAAGETLWTRRYAGPEATGADPVALSTDQQGNVIVTGTSMSGDHTRWHTLKFSPAGAQDWTVTSQIADTVHRLNLPTCMADDSSGNVYVASSEDSTLSFFGDFLTVKYNAGGVEQWRRRYDGPAHQFDEVRAIGCDRAGNVIVTGPSYDTATGFDYATVKYSPAGTLIWQVRYSGPGGDNNEDQPKALVLDAAGNVYVTGFSWDGGSMDWLTVKYSAAGQEQWTARYNGAGAGADIPRAIGLDAAGNVYVAGQAWAGSRGTDYAVASYSPTGTERWVRTYNGPGNYYDEALDLVVAGIDRVIITGRSTGHLTGYDFATIAYWPAGAIGEPSLDTPAAGGREPSITAMPNPCRRGANVRLQVAAGTQGAVLVYDASGRLVRSLPVPASAGTSRQSLAWDSRDVAQRLLPAGVYYLRLAGDEPSGAGARIVLTP